MLARPLWILALLSFPVLALSIGSSASAQSATRDEITSSDWAGIRAAYDAGRHAVCETESGYAGRNPGQGWRLDFDTRGFLVEPSQGGWSWGLELVSYGFEGSKMFVGTSACARSAGGRVAYSWDDGIEEWYVNDTRGFEHGFTVHERPASSDEQHGALTLELKVRGNLAPQVHANRHGISFLDESGAPTLNYSGLTVFDSEGRTLKAWFEVTATGLRLSIDEHGAMYPLTIDPVAQEAYLKASNPGVLDQFGGSVSISGDTIVVGAPGESSRATGVNGDENNDAEENSGAAYVFTRSGTSWSQEAYLKASNTKRFDRFGSRVSISGDTIIVAAPEEDSNATGVNGDESNNTANAAGAVYVFTRSGTIWSQEAYLKASNTDPDDTFGFSGDISGNTIVVGAFFEDSDATGVNGDENNDLALRSGAVYVFTRSGTSWGQEAYLKASSSDPDDFFGSSVSVSGDTIVVSATGEDSRATGVNGNQSNNLFASSGAAYVFQRSGTSWSQEAYLKASNTEFADLFGSSVSVSGDTVVVGARLEDSNATGLNGNRNNNSANDSGAAYVFTRSGSNWSQEAYIKASNTGNFDCFGCSVNISGDTLVIGAFSEQSAATGINGDQNSNLIGGAGAAYVFKRSAAIWRQNSYLKASATDVNDNFGSSVCVSGDTIVVGVLGDSSAATGVNGDPADNSAVRAGAAYVFLITSPLYSEFCHGDGGDQLGCTNCPCFNNAQPGAKGGCLNSSGRPARLFATGDASVSLPVGSTTDLRFALSGAPNNTLCVLSSGDGVAPGLMANPCFGLNSGLRSIEFDGLRCAIMNTRRHGGRASNSNGDVGTTGSPWGGEGGPNRGIAQAGAGFIAGQTRYFQVTYRENSQLSCMRGLNTSQAIEVTFEP